ncbi:DUF4296 domain-containing protein [Gramella sp. AN32]|nr:DUF4296 domain-containing protein [Gramella sp. AN32]
MLNSCQDLDKTEKPPNLISEAKMVDILTELALIQSARNYNKFKLEQTGIHTETYLYEKFNIDSLQLKENIQYYSSQYLTYDRIYDSVHNRIQRIKDKADARQLIERKMQDSLDSIKSDSLKIDRDSLQSKRDSISGIKTKDSLTLPPTLRKLDSMDRGN